MKATYSSEGQFYGGGKDCSKKKLAGIKLAKKTIAKPKEKNWQQIGELKWDYFPTSHTFWMEYRANSNTGELKKKANKLTVYKVTKKN